MVPGDRQRRRYVRAATSALGRRLLAWRRQHRGIRCAGSSIGSGRPTCSCSARPRPGTGQRSSGEPS